MRVIEEMDGTSKVNLVNWESASDIPVGPNSNLLMMATTVSYLEV